MKQHLSTFGLFARSSIFKVLGILLVMCAVEIAFFHFELQEAREAYEVAGSSLLPLELLFAQAATNVYFRIAFVLISIVLCLTGCEFKSKTGYTLRRLSVSETATFFHQAAYNAFVYWLLLAVQLVVVFGLSQYYVTVVPEECTSSLTITLAFYRNNFLHALLPLDDIGLWIRNGLLILSLALATAKHPYVQRRGKFSDSAIVLIIITIIFFDQKIAELSHVIIIGCISMIIIAGVIYTLARKDKEVDQNESVL